jgi:hypothetical protein
MKIIVHLASVGLLALVSGCGNDAAVPREGSSAASLAAAAVDPSLPKVVAYRSPTCGCCELWVEHMRAAGFDVAVEITDAMPAVKARSGVPAGRDSCHTAKVGDYFVEGHVPAADVKRLLAERPDARGITVPGMVVGSPGMEQGGASRPYEVLLVGKDGSTSVFARHE